MAKTTQTSKRSPSRRTVQTVDPKRQEFFKKYLYYLDGLTLYSKAQCPPGGKQFITMGWDIGRQIISQYVVEMLLQIRLEQQGGVYNINSAHNLSYLYRNLSEDDRSTVESVYKQLLNAEVEWTWDVYKTVDSFLEFLGKNPITKTRYPWQQQHVGTLYSPNVYRYLIYALFIGLHGYPVKDSLDKRFDTEFRPFSESRKHRYDSKGNKIAE